MASKDTLIAFRIEGTVTIGKGTRRTKIRVDETIRALSAYEVKECLLDKLSTEYFDGASNEVLEPYWRIVCAPVTEDVLMREISSPQLPGLFDA